MTSILINIDVADLERAQQFYTHAFELEVSRKLGSDFVELVGATASIYLIAERDGSKPFAGAERGRDYRRHWTPVHLDFVVSDLDVALQRVVDAGAILESGPRQEAWGKIAVLADPWGNGFCVLEFVGRGYDEIATEHVARAEQ